MKVHAQLISRLAAVPVLLLLSIGGLNAQTIAPTGSFGFLLGTSFSDPTNQGGAALLGLMNFDGAGHVKGPFTLEFGSGGQMPVTTITGTFTGTYSSNPDGTGTIAMALNNGINLALAMAIQDNGRGLQLVATSCSSGIDLSVSVFSGIGMHAKAFTLKSVGALKGSYAAQAMFSPQPSRTLAVATFDGAGNVTFAETFVGAGPNVQSASYSGAYTVSLNATGTITLAPTSGQGQQTYVFVMTDEGGPGLMFMQTNRLGNGVSFGFARLQ